MDSKKEKIKSVLLWIAVCLFSAGAFMLLGIAVGKNLLKDGVDTSDLRMFFLKLVGILVLFIVIMYFQIIIHESGHLVFGLLSGYKFSSFRIGSFLIQNGRDGLEFKKYKISGTAGQCIMEVPEYNDGNFKYKLYNMGGVLMNLITAAIFGILLVFVQGRVMTVVSIIFVFHGLYFVVTNGVPLSTSVPNDGMNVCMMTKDKAARKAFWVSLSTDKLLKNGIALKDMPAEWFEIPADCDKSNYLVGTLVCLSIQHFMDSDDFENAHKLIKAVIDKEYKVPQLAYAFIANDYAFLELKENGEQADISFLSEKSTDSILSKMKTTPDVLRTEYAIETLKNHDNEAASRVLELFNKTAETYPNPAEIEYNRKLISLL